MRWALAVGLAASAWAFAATASAFCGFYVAPGDQKLTNDATMVVMLRDGTRTVLSMQNDYQGPPEDFALVVPVPVVLQKDNVKTLDRSIFARVEMMAAPRLVEYWEQDPCPSWDDEQDNKEGGTGTRAKGEEGSMGNPNRYRPPAVWIEAKFAVGEYEVVILGANDALALDGWLRDNHYSIPQGAEEALRPYVTAGSKFFVAKVDTKKVQFVGGRARLSPLRFHYDSETFSLPVRLGLLNSAGHQDLVVHVLGHKRFDVANYPKATLPTNLELDESVGTRFGELYAAVFDATLAKHPGAVVTEYAWSYDSCDPCPTEPLSTKELEVLGADVAPNKTSGSWVLTRMHARYTKDQLGADLVFAEAPPIEGGREDGQHSTDAHPSSGSDNFQARFIVRHEWTGPILCSSPMRGMWGGPPSSSSRGRLPARLRDPNVARGKLELASVLRNRADTIDVVGRAPRVVSQDDDDDYVPRRKRLGWGALGGLGLALVLATISERRARATR